MYAKREASKPVTQHSSNAVALTTEATPASASKGKRFAKMAGAAVLSLGMVGTFALPAYANDAPGTIDPSMIDGFNNAHQSLSTENAADGAIAVANVAGDVDSEVVAQEAADKAAEEAKEAAEKAAAAAASGGATAAPAAHGGDIPAGVGGQGIANAALAQIGWGQDCTALVENSLRAVGIPAGDLGTQVGEYTGLGGYIVSDGAYAPGDVLVWSGRHVAVYIGNGQAVHGGYGGFQTVVASAFIDGTPSAVVRFG